MPSDVYRSCLVVLGGVLLAVGVLAAPARAEAAPCLEVRSPEGSVRAGEPILVSSPEGGCADPGARVEVRLGEPGVVLGYAHARVDGRYETSVVVPEEHPPGPHPLRVVTTWSGEPVGYAGMVEVTATSPGVERLGDRQALMVLWVALVAVAGGAFLAFTWRRWRHARAVEHFERTAQDAGLPLLTEEVLPRPASGAEIVEFPRSEQEHEDGEGADEEDGQGRV